MTNVEALQALYTALGGEPADIVNASTIVEVLNTIAAKYEGQDDATLNAEAIANIAAVADKISGGGDVNFTKISGFVRRGAIKVDFINNTSSDVENVNSGTCTLVNPLRKFTCGSNPGYDVAFTPTEDFDGFYRSNGDKINFSGSTVTPGDGNVYAATISFMGNTYDMEKLGVVPIFSIE